MKVINPLRRPLFAMVLTIAVRRRNIGVHFIRLIPLLPFPLIFVKYNRWVRINYKIRTFFPILLV
jgi:hypothetical protein